MTSHAWLDEIDLDPNSSWLRMGTRSLGERPWLTGDTSCLAERASLLNERQDDVLIVPSGSAEDGFGSATIELATLVAGAAGLTLPSIGPGHAGVREWWMWLGTSVAEDLCLLRRGPVEWELEGGVLCFPSRWRFADRVGRPMRDVHGPVEDYDPVLADRITSLLDRLDDRVVIRRNWFVHPDPARFQPVRPAGGDRLVRGAAVLDELFVRSERQTLRSLPLSGRVVFTIATQQCSLGEFVADADRRNRFVDHLHHAPVEQVTHRGMGVEQAAEIMTVLAD